MEKYEQLRRIREWGLPTPRFKEVTHAQYKDRNYQLNGLRFPVAVRSSYHTEDGDRHSQAGQFKTLLNVHQPELENALREAFSAYPNAQGSRVIVQEMVAPDYSGVLFAYRKGIWKVELIEGQGEALVSGRRRPQTFLLPRFTGADRYYAHIHPFWRGVHPQQKGVNRALIQLSAAAGHLLRRINPTHGLDIEFAIRKNRLYLLQARPITTPDEAEEALTSANHKEILPPKPSRLMSSIIVSAGPALFQYYRALDETLPQRSFIQSAGGMPWINLSALLDVMVYWGLPTSLVCRSVGAEDPYQAGFRPLRFLVKLPVFARMLAQQRRVKREIRSWLRQMPQQLALQQRERARWWQEEPVRAFTAWREDFTAVYVQLVTYMQTLTGGMSGPVALLQRLGWLSPLAAGFAHKSMTSQYQAAFRQLKTGRLSREAFIRQFGRRGFYESDLGQKRFVEYDIEEWRRLIGPSAARKEDYTNEPPPKKNALAQLFSWVFELIHLREELRHEVMKWFFDFRIELLTSCRRHLSPGLEPWDYHWPELERLLSGNLDADDIYYEPQSGWDQDTFLCNRLERRLPLSMLHNLSRQDVFESIGIYPGRVSGQVWRVQTADLNSLRKPPFPKTILVADALDPGWVPFFSQVEGVIAYVGGLLSHASILLRENAIPSITQLPASLDLQTGEWIEMDGKTGKVIRLKDFGEGE